MTDNDLIRGLLEKKDWLGLAAEVRGSYGDDVAIDILKMIYSEGYIDGIEHTKSFLGVSR